MDMKFIGMRTVELLDKAFINFLNGNYTVHKINNPFTGSTRASDMNDLSNNIFTSITVINAKIIISVYIPLKDQSSISLESEYLRDVKFFTAKAKSGNDIGEKINEIINRLIILDNLGEL